MGKEVKVTGHENVPWMARLEFRYDVSIVNLLREVPGAVWDTSTRMWVVPVDMLEIVVREFADNEYNIEIEEELVPYLEGDHAQISEEYELTSTGN